MLPLHEHVQHRWSNVTWWPPANDSRKVFAGHSPRPSGTDDEVGSRMLERYQADEPKWRDGLAPPEAGYVVHRHSTTGQDPGLVTSVLLRKTVAFQELLDSQRHLAA